jgi:CheY-like chemotaxis protein
MAKILLVEDNEMNRDMLSRRLAKKGYQLVVAVNGMEAVTLAKAENPDLILMDLRMPDMDGWEVTRRIRSESSTAGIPVIALTSYAMAGDREMALQAGCNDYETKPVNLPRLHSKIKLLLGEPTVE